MYYCPCILVQLYFSSSTFSVLHPPSAAPIGKVVETGVRELVPPCSSCLDTSVALAAAVQSPM